jgi:hypothetical protein
VQNLGLDDRQAEALSDVTVFRVNGSCIAHFGDVNDWLVELRLGPSFCMGALAVVGQCGIQEAIRAFIEIVIKYIPPPVLPGSYWHDKATIQHESGPHVKKRVDL